MSDISIVSPFQGGSHAIQPLGHFGRAILRVRVGEVAQVSERLGISLPTVACRAQPGQELNALWQGPDEWLLMSAANMASSSGWVDTLTNKLGDAPCSLVDISHRQVALALQGSRAEEILSSECALDLSLTAFPVGMCTRTMYAKAEVVLWRTGVERFHIEVWRSFARYVEALLRESENE